MRKINLFIKGKIMIQNEKLIKNNLPPAFSLETHIKQAWDFYTNKLKSPKHITAPMVEQSDLAFRMLTRKYQADLCYTPMMNSKIMTQDKNYLKSNFEIEKLDRPLFVQLCGNDPHILLKAAKMIENDCDAIDINLGCPQGIARKGHYGSFLLKESDLICKMVRILHDNLTIPVTCKMRILEKEEETIDLCKKIEEAGCSILTIHGRTKEQNKDYVGEVNWEIVKKIRTIIKIPMFCNGGIYNYEDIERCLQYTKVQGIMSSEALLENPCLFSNKMYDLDLIAEEYLEFCKKFKSDIKYIKPHLFKILYSGLQKNHDLRERLAKSFSFEEFSEITEILKKRRENCKNEEKFGWYLRHQNKEKKFEIEVSSKKEENKEAKVLEKESEIKDNLYKKRKLGENDEFQYKIEKIEVNNN